MKNEIFYDWVYIGYKNTAGQETLNMRFEYDLFLARKIENIESSPLIFTRVSYLLFLYRDPYLGEQLAAQSPESAAKMLEQEGKTLNAHQKESKRHGHQAGGISPRSQRATDQAASSPQFTQVR